MFISNPHRFYNIIAYYGFNGNANDRSGRGNNGIVSGATLTTDRNIKSNSAYQFDGDDDYIETNVTAPLSGSISIIFKYVSGGNYVYIGTQASATGRCYLGISTGTPQLRANIGDVSVNYSGTLTTDTYYHFVATWDRTNVKIYVNGNFENSDQQVNDVNTGHPYIIGGNNNAGTYQLFAPTTIDKVIIYNSILTDEQILNYYNLHF